MSLTPSTRTAGGNSESRAEPGGSLTDDEAAKPDPTFGRSLLNYTIFGTFGVRELGILAIAAAAEATDDEESAAPQRQYVVIEELKDRLICSRWKDGAIFTPTGELEQVFVAKPHNARRTVWEDKTIEGILYTYPDPDDHSLRVATRTGENPVFQRYVNPYIPEFSLIYAIESEDGTEVASTSLVDQNNDGRNWAVERPLET